MREYEAHRKMILRMITARDAPPPDHRCGICRSSQGQHAMKWRCHDCFGDPVFCSGCLRDTHYSQPYHRVSWWNGRCFVRSSLAKAGVTLNLGHAGALCPRYRPSDNHLSSLNRTPSPLLSVQSHTELGHDVTTVHDNQRASPTFHMAFAPGDSGEVNAQPIPLNLVMTPEVPIDEPFDDDLPPLDESQVLAELPESEGAINPSNVASFPLQPHPSSLTNDNHPTAAHIHDSPLLRSPAASAIEVEFEVDAVDPDQQRIHLDPFVGELSDDEGNLTNTTNPQPSQRHQYDEYQCPLLTIIDITGIHELRTRFCRCHTLDQDPLSHQLIAMGLYPASLKQSRTVFTFRVLEDFNLSNLEGKVTGFAYFNKLRRLTSNITPKDVSDRYRELLRAARQWRDIEARQRAGELFESEAAEMDKGGLALFCPTCPQPGVNLPDGWETDAKK